MGEQREAYSRIDKSNISGCGTFATKRVRNNVEIGCAFMIIGSNGIQDKDITSTELGALTNHSSEPNLLIKRDGNKYIYVARRDIEKDEELTVDYSEIGFDGKKDFNI